MIRRLWPVLLCAGLSLAQEDDEGMTVDEAPPAEGGSRKPARTTPFPARAPGAKPGLTKISRKGYALALPADWVLQDFDAARAELGWDILLPGSTGRARLLLVRQEDLGDPRSTPYYWRDSILKEDKEARTEVRPEPVPRLLAQRTGDGGETASLYLFLAVRNNPFYFEFHCAPGEMAAAEQDLLAMVRSFKADAKLWPPVPEGYQAKEEGIWLVARHPGVKTSVSTVEKLLKDQEKRFRKDHGPLPKCDAPIVVLVHATRSDAAKVDPNADKSEQGFYADFVRRRLFVVPVDKNNLDQQGFLADAIHRMLFFARYGDSGRGWMFVGESAVARAELMTGSPLPNIHEGFYGWTSGLKLRRIDEIDQEKASENENWGKECFFYMCMFQGGKYKKEYRAFLDDLAATADGRGAYERHIAPLDPEAVRAAAEEFMSTKLKPVKPK